jgi:hypothetical protein
MIQIDLTQQNSNHPARRKRHRARARCEVADRRYETSGPAPVYKLSTLLWLHGNGGERFEVHDDVSPFAGNPNRLLPLSMRTLEFAMNHPTVVSAL